MSEHRDRMTVRIFKIIEGEAEGRFAIVALTFAALFAIVVVITISHRLV
jgi:hypothetical protein